ncbi:MAG: hypothetical protein HKN03_02995 [Acidimicrobiales bacterium]|nr:hypothetical protein [Acidimicrobiales bacterium]
MSDRKSLLAEQSFLLDSLDDLEDEYAAGDLDSADYEELKKDYTVRTAQVARKLKGLDAVGAVVPEPSRSKWLWVAFLAVFGVVAGWLLALSVGERGVGDNITGSIEESSRQQVFRCQELGQNPATLVDSFDCFDDLLERDPTNAEALAYRGWYGVLLSGSAQTAGENEAAVELLATAGTFLDRAIEADRTYPDARAFRMIVLERLGRVEEACADYAVLGEINPPGMIGQLTAPVAERLGCR